MRSAVRPVRGRRIRRPARRPARVPVHDAGFLPHRRVLKAETGITLTEVKAPLVYARLVKRVRDLGLENFRAYCTLIAWRRRRGRASADDRGADHQRHPLLPRAAPLPRT
jgi:hypothetical protein